MSSTFVSVHFLKFLMHRFFCFVLMKYIFLILLLPVAFLRTLYQPPSPKDGLLCLFIPKSFMVLGFILRSVIHLKLIFVYNAR